MGEYIFKPSADDLLPRDICRRMLADLRLSVGKTVKVTVEPLKRKRSSHQNRYYFGVIIPAVTAAFRDAGNMVDGEDVHDFLKLRVGKLAQVIVLPDGEVVKGLGSTAKLTPAEFEDYLAAIRAWASEQGLDLPLPHEG